MTPSRKMSKHLNGTWDAGQWDGCEPGTLNLPIQHAQVRAAWHAKVCQFSFLWLYRVKAISI